MNSMVFSTASVSGTFSSSTTLMPGHLLQRGGAGGVGLVVAVVVARSDIDEADDGVLGERRAPRQGRGERGDGGALQQMAAGNSGQWHGLAPGPGSNKLAGATRSCGRRPDRSLERCRKLCATIGRRGTAPINRGKIWTCGIPGLSQPVPPAQKTGQKLPIVCNVISCRFRAGALAPKVVRVAPDRLACCLLKWREQMSRLQRG